MQGTKPAFWFAILAACVITVGACSSESTNPSGPSSSVAPPPTQAVERPLNFNPVGNVRRTDILGADPESSSTRGNIAVHNQLAFFHTARGVTAIDIVTGESRWNAELIKEEVSATVRRNIEDKLTAPLVETSSGDVFVARPGENGTMTVLRITSRNGEIAWSHEVPASQQIVFGGVVGVDEQHVLVSTFGSPTSTTTSLDAATGNQLWHEDGHYAMGMSRGVVFSAPPYQSNVVMRGVLATDGSEKWQLTGDYDQYAVLAATDQGFAITRVNRSNQQTELLWVAAETGEMKVAETFRGTSVCFDDTSTFVACTVPGVPVGTIVIDEMSGQVLRRMPQTAADADGFQVESAFNGIAYGIRNNKPVSWDISAGTFSDLSTKSPFAVTSYGALIFDSNSIKTAYPEGAKATPSPS